MHGSVANRVREHVIYRYTTDPGALDAIPIARHWPGPGQAYALWRCPTIRATFALMTPHRLPAEASGRPATLSNPVPGQPMVLFLAFWAVLAATPAIAGAQTVTELDPSATYRIPLGDAPALGPSDAPITIVEFSDFGCPYCGRAQRTLVQLMRLYPGKIRLVYRHNPLDLQDGSLAAEASVAALRQGAFWAMHDRIFAAGGIVNRTQVEGFALDLGLDIGTFRRDLDDRNGFERVQKDARLAHQLGVFSTPIFFINGRAIRGARPLGVFVRVIEQELARVKQLRARGVAANTVYKAIMASAIVPAAAPKRADSAQDDDHGYVGLEPTRLYRVGLGLPGHTVGPADALVTVVVFSDFECPFCAKLEPILSAMRAEFPDDVRIVIRHLPLRMHRNAQLAAEAVAAAAAQDKMWAMHERIFARATNLTRLDLERHASAIGLDMRQFRAALSDRKYLDAISADAAAANAMGVTGTPTLFINGTPVRGVAPYPYMRETFLIPKLAQARALVARGVARTDVYPTLMKMADRLEVGHSTRFPNPSGDLQLDQDDVHTAAIQACLERNPERAKNLYDALGKPTYRHHVRVTCQPYGVDLPARPSR
ncbi:MAG: thioredoxin domain-containing protein [Proteobacteria bacterium]|nr:thioredoxin domain-containing protein [Pseudomonadota bacterium]